MKKPLIISGLVAALIIVPIVVFSSQPTNAQFVIEWEPVDQFPLSITNDDFTVTIEEATFSLQSVEATICQPNLAWWQPQIALAANSSVINEISPYTHDDLEPRRFDAWLEADNYCQIQISFSPTNDQPTIYLKGSIDSKLGELPFLVTSTHAQQATRDINYKVESNSEIGITFNLPLLFTDITTEQTNNNDELVKELVSNLIEFATIRIQ